jgi:hypothetical protein
MLRWSMQPVEDEGEIVSVEVTCHRWRPEYDPPIRHEPSTADAGRCPNCARPVSERSACLELPCKNPGKRVAVGESKVQPLELAALL